jgi:hypothetical protein
MFVGTFSPPQAPALAGCVEMHGLALVGADVKFKQKGKAQTAVTDSAGCYAFDRIISGKDGLITIELPVLP